MNSFAIKKTSALLAASVLAFVLACAAFCGQAFAEEKGQSTTYQTSMSVFLDNEVPPAGAFQFQMTPETDGAPLPAESVVSNDAGGNIDFVLVFTQPGTYEYVISQIPGSDDAVDYDSHEERIVYTAEYDEYGNLLVEADYGDSDFVFLNLTAEEAVSSLTLGIGTYVNLDGRPIVAGEFAFRLDPVTAGAPEFSSSYAVCNEEGDIEFGEAEFSEEGVYEYTMYQVAGDDPDMIYDLNKFTVLVNVFFDEDGMMDCEVTCNGGDELAPFYNTYVGGDEQVAPETQGSDEPAQADPEPEAKPEAKSEFPQTADNTSVLVGILAAAAAVAGAAFGIARKRLNA